MAERRKVAVLTTGRQDWSILRSTCLLLRDDPRLELQLVVAGMHLDPRHGGTESEIAAEGFRPAARLETSRGSPACDAAAMVELLVPALERLRAEMLVLVGDRTETAAAALGAVIARVPLVHLHGGEETEGAIDNSLRHAITKLAHLHLVSNEAHARRVRQMGELDSTVHVVGAPGLDNLRRKDLPDRAAVEAFLRLSLRKPVVLVTHHPTTLAEKPLDEGNVLVDAMSAVDATWVITLPNNDCGSAAIRDAFLAFANERPERAVAVEALGLARYAAMLGFADAMLGNSSSGIIEAPVLALPVVNVGDRQRGRTRGANVIDVPADARAIAAALRRALEPGFRAALSGKPSPYGDGRSAPRVAEALAQWTPPSPPRKRFQDAG